jgi:hypothetical protein
MTVKKLLFVPLMAALACGGSSSSGSLSDQSRDALPNKSSVAMNTPGGTSTALKQAPSGELIKSGASPDAVSNDFYFGLTVSVVVISPAPVAAFLDLVSDITANEPTSCIATSCTWGPGSAALDPNTYELTVSKDSDGKSFDWTLAGQAKSKPGSAFTPIAFGVATPSGTAHHGSGSFTVDFDAAATLDGTHTGTGKMVINSYSNTGPAQLSVTYTGATDSTILPAQLENIAYSYAEDASGGGDLQFALHNVSASDNFSTHSRWKNDGSGRSDFRGMGAGITVQDSDCWGPAPFTQVFFTSSVPSVNSPPFAGPNVGVETSCAFSPAVFSTLTVQ